MPYRKLSPALNAMARGSLGVPARCYYRMKPFIPQSLRMYLRRTRVPGILKRSAGIWPIDEAAAEPPDGWTGWPDGRRFALVITHDVESARGQRHSRQLAELEMRHGFRSSFNFIPEGPYRDCDVLRDWLTDHGFEVGVHDLNHDGHLYQSREGFRKKAGKINSYLKKWGAVGFRSGFMIRQLDWLHDLDVLYDSSTFDTDPFEPQPEGSGTIFPFHVRPPAGVKSPGYVEMPYTLPQDSTLFLLLKEETTGIWESKLEWIARHGGLALVNIHPDYVDFSGRWDSTSAYPVAILEGFLRHIRTTYGNTFWNPLPCELATWFRGSVPHPPP